MGITFLLYNLLINIVYPITYASELPKIYASSESEQTWQSINVLYRCLTAEIGLSTLLQMILFIEKVSP